ncbi:MAG TPA: hypothetical protein VGJ21_14785 [Terracidiphilus sp.]|jgi:hypothetical protein
MSRSDAQREEFLRLLGEARRVLDAGFAALLIAPKAALPAWSGHLLLC